MEIDVMGDIISFGISILGGFIIGVIFDMYRAFRHISRSRRILSYLEDILFWLIIGIIFFALLVKTTDGVLRGFIFIGCFSGGLLYLLLLSKYLLSLFILIFKLILEVISEIIRIIIYPFKKGFVFSKKQLNKIVLVPKILFKEMGRYRKILSRKK